MTQQEAILDILQSKVPSVEARMMAVRSLKAWNAVKEEIKRNNIVEDGPKHDMISTDVALLIINNHLRKDVDNEKKKCWI